MVSKKSTRYEYRIANGAHITKSQAEPLFEVIRDKFKGERPTPEQLVREAKRKNSPINHLFDWDVETAAQAHWRARAAYYLRSIDVVEVEVRTQKIVRGPVRFAMPAVYDVSNTHRILEYTPTQRLGKEPVANVLERARCEFKSWRARYGAYVEFFDMFDPVLKEFDKVEAIMDSTTVSKK